MPHERPKRVQQKFAIRRIDHEGKVTFAGRKDGYDNEYSWVDSDGGMMRLYKTQAGAETAIRNSWKLKLSLASREHGGDESKYIIEIVEFDLVEVKAHEYKSV